MLHARVQQIETVLKVVTPDIAIKDPVPRRASCAESVPIPTRLLVAALDQRKLMSHRKLLHASGKLRHGPAERQATGDRDVARVPRAVVHVDACVGNTPDVDSIGHNADARGTVDGRASQAVNKDVREMDLAGQGRLLYARLAEVRIDSVALMGVVAVVRAVCPIADVETTDINEL